MVKDLASFCHLSFPLNLYLLYMYVSMCVCVGLCTFHAVHVEEKGQLGGIRSLSLPCMSQGPNSGCHA